MERVRPVVAVLSALLVATVARGRSRRAAAETAETPAGDAVTTSAPAEAAAVPNAGAGGRSGAPWSVARLDRALAVLGTAGLLITVGLTVWEVAGLGPSAPAAGGLDGPFVALLATAIVWAAYLFWKVPQWQAGGARTAALDGKERFELENAARATIGQLLSGVAVIAGLLFAWQQLGSASETLRVSQEGQITERFTRAVDQLGSEDATIRLGGIYALERIARDSERDEGPVTEVLAAYVRDHAPRDVAGATPAAGPAGVAVDVRAVLAILTARNAPRNGDACVDLSGTNLAGADLAGANLEGACLASVDLSGAGLEGATLTGATLDEAELQNARLGAADLTRASLAGVSLTGTDLRGATLAEANLLSADLRGAAMLGAAVPKANFNGADLGGAFLGGVDLSEARALTQEQIDAAFTDRQTRWPPGLEARPDM